MRDKVLKLKAIPFVGGIMLKLALALTLVPNLASSAPVVLATSPHVKLSSLNTKSSCALIRP